MSLMAADLAACHYRRKEKRKENGAAEDKKHKKHKPVEKKKAKKDAPKEPKVYGADELAAMKKAFRSNVCSMCLRLSFSRFFTLMR